MCAAQVHVESKVMQVNRPWSLDQGQSGLIYSYQANKTIKCLTILIVITLFNSNL